MLINTRLSAAEVAMLTIFLFKEYDRDKGKNTSRARISQATLRVLSERQRLRASFVEDWIDELSSLGWSAFPVGDNFAIIETNTVTGWARISAKRLKSVMMRISIGDDSAMAEVAAAVRSTAVTEAEDDE